MRRSLLALAAFMVMLAASGAAFSTEFRRPFDEAISLGYGYDHDGGASGCKAYDCGGRCYNGHRGSDFPLPYGTNVRAAADGTVVYVSQGCADVGYYCSNCGGGYGNYVKLSHSDGRETYYAHLKNGSVTVAVGQSVDCGQKLGESASSGCSTGYHLHFEQRVGGARVDPFAGTCDPGSSDWVDQGGGLPSTQCEVTCACNPGDSETQSCGNCGSRQRDCASDCQWSGWSSCQNEGPCSEGESETRQCGDCGEQTRTCDSNCQWGAFDACEGPDPDGGNRVCDTGLTGPCAEGRDRCRSGNITCEANYEPSDELCDGVDNDCDGTADEEQPDQLGESPPDFAAKLVDASHPRVAPAGEPTEVWADFRNVGASSWPAGRVWLEPMSPRDGGGKSPLFDEGTWQAEDVASVFLQDVPPGSVARLEFAVRPPLDVSTATESFQLRTPNGDDFRCPQPGFDIALQTYPPSMSPPASSDSPDISIPDAGQSAPVIRATGEIGCGCVARGNTSAPSALLVLVGLILIGRRRRFDRP